MRLLLETIISKRSPLHIIATIRHVEFATILLLSVLQVYPEYRKRILDETALQEYENYAQETSDLHKQIPPLDLHSLESGDRNNPLHIATIW